MSKLQEQAFQPAGGPDFQVRWTKNGRLESRPNPQAGKPALRTCLGSRSQCMRESERGPSMQRQVVARASRPCVGSTIRTGVPPAQLSALRRPLVGSGGCQVRRGIVPLARCHSWQPEPGRKEAQKAQKIADDQWSVSNTCRPTTDRGPDLLDKMPEPWWTRNCV
jgi:hypothetical protein